MLSKSWLVSLGRTVLQCVQPSLLSRDLLPWLVATQTNSPGLEPQILSSQVSRGQWSQVLTLYFLDNAGGDTPPPGPGTCHQELQVVVGPHPQSVS